jgi:hypothetical protein
VLLNDDPYGKQEVNVLNRLIHFLKSVNPQRYVNIVIDSIGLLADSIALLTFFQIVHTPQTGSNFYVNSREFLTWVLIAWLYSFGLVNAYIRRRWRRKYGSGKTDHSILNVLSLMTPLTQSEKEKAHNFKRDFSFVYLVMFLFTFVFSRAVTATEHATGVTPSPWGDFFLTVILTFPISFVMMAITIGAEFIAVPNSIGS